jgi:uncharacterized protein (TIGR02145 family)
MSALCFAAATVLLSAWLPGCSKKPERETVSITTGMLTDSRDGKTYRTVTIGKQVWMAENLDYYTDSSMCVYKTSSKCKRYGRLYSWNEAMTACPAGWHLPSSQEWDNLITAVGGDSLAGKKLKAKHSWDRDEIHGGSGNGTDDYGFSALPGGDRGDEGKFNIFDGSFGNWWTSTGNSYGANQRRMSCLLNHVYEVGIVGSVACSVRCVADSESETQTAPDSRSRKETSP